MGMVDDEATGGSSSDRFGGGSNSYDSNPHSSSDGEDRRAQRERDAAVAEQLRQIAAEEEAARLQAERDAAAAAAAAAAEDLFDVDAPAETDGIYVDWTEADWEVFADDVLISGGDGLDPDNPDDGLDYFALLNASQVDERLTVEQGSPEWWAAIETQLTQEEIDQLKADMDAKVESGTTLLGGLLTIGSGLPIVGGLVDLLGDFVGDDVSEALTYDAIEDAAGVIRVDPSSSPSDLTGNDNDGPAGVNDYTSLPTLETDNVVVVDIEGVDDDALADLVAGDDTAAPVKSDDGLKWALIAVGASLVMGA